jgi:hypothetical protein
VLTQALAWTQVLASAHVLTAAQVPVPVPARRRPLDLARAQRPAADAATQPHAAAA